jgi:DNA-binding MarR family transcriptional regulator
MATPSTRRSAASRRKPGVPAPLTVSRKELLDEGNDRQFRELVHAFFAFQARHEAIRDGHAGYIGLAGVQYTLLISVGHLETEGEVTATTLCDHLHVSSAFIAVEIAKLVERGLLAKERDANDARRLLLRTTPAGYALLARLAPLQSQVNNVEFGRLSKKDFRDLHRIMNLLIENCDAALALQRLLEQPGASELRIEETIA